ncbi:hypothetical protein I5T99_12680 [Stenotrophomonas maltophilia]|nr:hypothetical protein [Stenotrophomonas maltophilia]
MYQLTNNPDIIRCVDTGADIPRGHWMWSDYQRWLDEGNTPLPVALPYVLYSPEHFRAIRDAAFAWMTDAVKARGYDDLASCASYYNSSVTRYQQEARALVAWRDAVNQALEQLVLAPPAGIETWEQVRALLPQPETFAWPEKAELPLETGSPAVVL